MIPNISRIGLTIFLCVLLFASTAVAQNAAVSGVVQDSSGGILPGVTVEAESPALIEGARVAFTNGEGRFNITDLRPGTYSVTFTLPGFSVIRREGIELTTGFTANVSPEMQVGGIEETITVTGESPLVDVQNVRRQTAVTNETLELLPTSNKHINTVVTFTAGFTGLADVGGQYTCQLGGGCGTSEGFHGKAGSKVSIDGMGMENMSGVGNSSYVLNAASVEEMVLQTSGISAETNSDGPVLNIIPKEGGNTFSGTLLGTYSNDSMESDNLSDELKAKGLETPNVTTRIYDKSISVGGPIKRDKVWFFAAGRSWGYGRNHAGVFWNKTQDPSYALSPPGANALMVPYTKWLDRPRDRNSGRWQWTQSLLGRFTFQATPKNKFTVTLDTQEACNCGSTSGGVGMEESFSYRFNPNRLYQVAYTAPLTSRILVEAGVGLTLSHWHQFRMPGVNSKHVMIRDIGIGQTWGARNTYIGHPNDSDRHTQRFAVSYVTGSHSVKTGIYVEEGILNTLRAGQDHNTAYLVFNMSPILLTQFATPYEEQGRFRETGLYLQDQWTIDRLTLNLGLRVDIMDGWVPAQTIEASGSPSLLTPGSTPNGWVAARSFDRVDGLPSWRDINPRMGMAYDLSGDGKTALKLSLGRYVRKTGVDIARSFNPINTSVNSVNRSWSDSNFNFFPDCDLGDFTANGECAAINNSNFGQNNPNATIWGDEVNGWGTRDHNWDLSAEVQQEVLPGLSVTAGYYFNNGGYYHGDSNVRMQDNLSIGPEDFDEYCVTAPVDSRLPGGGGQEICGLYDLKPEKFGQVNNLITETKNFGSDVRRNHFINMSWDARLPNGIQFGGGVDSGISTKNRCMVVDSPEQETFFRGVGFGVDPIQFCNVTKSMSAQTQLKMFGSMPLPGGFGVSGTMQNLSGGEILANWAATNADVGPSLGRALSGGARNVIVPLVGPEELHEARITRLDIRVSNRIALPSGLLMSLNFDAYNAFNSNSIRQTNESFGSSWLRPNQILDPRIFQVTAQLDF